MKTRIYWIVGGVFLVLCLTRVGAEPRPFHAAYLIAYLLWLGISLGAAILWMLHNLVGGEWGVAARPALRAATRTLPLMIILFLPHLRAIPILYPWGEGKAAAQAMAWYLNAPFFYGRAAACFAVWMIFALLLERRSGRSEAFSAIGLLLYAVTISIAAFDWVLSLDLANRSTIFGLLVISGQFLGALAFAIFVLLTWRHPSQPKRLAPQTLHDLANLLFMAVLIWAYLTYSQLIITWSGNMQEEVVWYAHRLSGGWPVVAVLLATFNFVVPFGLLLFRPLKRNPQVMAPLALILVFMQWVNTTWLVLPSVTPGDVTWTWLQIAAPVAVGALWLGSFKTAWGAPAKEEVHDVWR